MASLDKAVFTRDNLNSFRNKLMSSSTKEALSFYIYISPWLIGFLAFTLGPFMASLILSFTRWDMVQPIVFTSISNYTQLIGRDPLFRRSLYNTVYFVIFSVPLQQAMCIGLALLLNQQLRGISIYRTIFYLPSVTAGVATAYLWAYLFSTHNGLLNTSLAAIGIQGPRWLMDPAWSKPALIMMSLWGGGNAMIIYLAGLQGVPTHLHEAAKVDGATVLHRFWHVTIPMITPTIFYNLVMGFIGAFNVFTAAYVITAGGPANSTLFYMLYLYRRAFQDFRMGYASAMAWILFLIILSLTMLQLVMAKRWVYYEYQQQGSGII